MRLGFHYHIPALQKDGQIWMPGYLGRFIDSLAENCDEVVCFLHDPLPPEKSNLDYALQSSKVKLVNIGPHVSIPKRMVTAPQIARQIRQYRNQLDVMLIRGPSPLLPEIAAACKNLPLALLIVGDYLAGVDDLPQPRWRKEAIRAWSWWNAQRQLKVAKKSLTFVNSHILYQHYAGKAPNLIETRTTTLIEGDFFVREDTCQGKPVRLLYTGRMAGAKGIIDILEAVKQLVEQGEDIVFDLVGMIEKGDPVLVELQKKAKAYGISDRMIYHGYRPVGPELFDFYKRADIYVIASQSSEGFPRTIWEAMANSLPVIATKVGSIPDFIGDAAILVEPRKPDSLAQQIKRLMNHSELRRNMIKNGLLLARSNTLSNRSKEMIVSMEEYLECRNPSC